MSRERAHQHLRLRERLEIAPRKSGQARTELDGNQLYEAA
jgi:hypothetical protein